jgi:hypothetical protein
LRIIVKTPKKYNQAIEGGAISTSLSLSARRPSVYAPPATPLAVPLERLLDAEHGALK